MTYRANTRAQGSATSPNNGIRSTATRMRTVANLRRRAELNGEEKPEKAPRRTRTGGEGSALRNSYEDEAPDLPVGEGETGPELKPGAFGPQNKGRGNAGKKNPHNKPHRDNPVKPDGMPEKKAGPGGEKRKQKQKNRFNRPNNVRKKDASGGKNTDGNGQ